VHLGRGLPSIGAVRARHALLWTGYAALMIQRSVFDELGERLAQAARSAPAEDLEKNLRALVLAFFERFDLVAREDFDVQKRLLERAQAKLAALETRIVELEARTGPKPPA